MRKATLNASSAWTQGSSNPRKHDAANGEDAFVTRSPVASEQLGAANSWIRRISSAPTTTVPNARASARGVSTQRSVGSYGESGEAGPDQADAQDDRAVHEGFRGGRLRRAPSGGQRRQHKPMSRPTPPPPRAPRRGEGLLPQPGTRTPTESGDPEE